MSMSIPYDIGSLHIEIHEYLSTAAQHPGVTIEAPDNLKVIGGGAWVEFLNNGQGSMLTEIYPMGPKHWRASAKDHNGPASASIVHGFLIGACMKDGSPIGPDDYLIQSQESVPGEWPMVEAVLPDGWILVGGGAKVNGSMNVGSLLTGSYPRWGRSWVASAKSHEISNVTTVTAFAIGVKQSFLVRAGLKTKIRLMTSPTETNWPSQNCSLDQGYSLLSGGAKTEFHGAGSMLVASHPLDRHTWIARSKDHHIADPSAITSFAIGISI